MIRRDDAVSGREIERIFRASGIELSECHPPQPMPRRDGPPTDMGRAVRWWLAGMLAGALMWAALGATAWWALGCATGRIVRDDVEITCAAIGEDAKVTYSVPTGDAGIITSAPTQLVACEGGPLVPSLLSGVGTVFRALWALLPWAA